MARDYNHYEDLVGAEGRALFYRPERFEPAQVFGEIPIELQFNDVRCTLANVSAAGVGFYASSALAERERGVLTLRVGASVVLEQRAEIRWSRAAGSRHRVGVQLLGDGVQIDALRRKARLAATVDKLSPQNNFGVEPVPERFRTLGMELLCLLRSTREQLDRLEASSGPLTETAREALVDEIEPHFYAALEAIWLEMNEIAVANSESLADRRAIKQFVALTLRPEFMDGPMWRRATEKPLGYPGDYKVMLHAYGDSSGPCSLYGAVLHRVMAVRCGACVRGRKELMRAALERELGRGDDVKRAMRVTNLGAGPAREIRDLLSADLLRRPVDVRLVDQDSGALQKALDDSMEHCRRHGDRAKITGLCSSFLDILKKGPLYDEIQQQDVIYSLGLIDYFKDASVRALVKGMYDKLRPGGLLALCNMKAGPHSLYLPLDLVCDWELIYRTEDQMRQFAKGLGSEDARPEVDVVAEPSDKVLMLFVRKPHEAAPKIELAEADKQSRPKSSGKSRKNKTRAMNKTQALSKA